MTPEHAAARCDWCGALGVFYLETGVQHRAVCSPCYAGRPETWRPVPPKTSTALALPAFDDERSRTLAETYKEQHEAVAAHVLAHRVTDPESQTKAAHYATTIKERRELVAKELEFATQLRRFANQFSARWNPALKPLDACLDHLRDELAGYTERSRAAVAAALTQATSTQELAVATATIVPQPDGVIERTTWSAEVTVSPEVTRAALLALDDERVNAILAVSIPAEYLSVDISRADKEAREQHEQFNVPGLRAVKSVSVAIRG